MKLLYLFSGERKKKFIGVPGVDYPDTQLYGFNHMRAYGITAETKEWSDVIRSPFIGRLIGFRLRHLVMFFVARKYDVVFGSSLLYLVALKKVFRIRTKFVLFNLGMTRTLAAHRNHPIRLKFLVWLIEGFDAVVCLSHVQRETVERVCPRLKGRVHFVPLGVDTQYYQPYIDDRNDRILSAGRDNGRDYQTVVEVARRLPEQSFDIVCSPRNLKGVGDIPRNVTVHYDLPITALADMYHRAKLLLLLTHSDQWLDGSDCSGQTVLLDAMANGLPVIASKKQYLVDYLTPGVEAMVVPCYDPEEVVATIRTLHDTTKRRSLAFAARARAEQSFSTTEMAKRLAAIFTSLV